MNTFKGSRQVAVKIFLVLLLALLAFQSLGLNGLAAPGGNLQALQSGTPLTMPLSCGASAQTPSYCNIQIVLMLDDSGSMKSNDPGRLRNQGAINVVNMLADQYYPAAQALYASNSDFQLPDVRVAVIHFSEGVKRKSGWITIDPSNADVNGWKTDLINEIKWPEQGTPDYRAFYSTTQWTDFQEAFTDASKLLLSKDAKTVSGDCTRRAILLFTDGTPESAKFRGILTGQPLTDEMNSIKETFQTIRNSLPDGFKPELYVTGFKLTPRYQEVWDNSLAKKWDEIEKISEQVTATPTSNTSAAPVAPTPPADTVKRIDLLKPNVSLDQLPARMEEITASLINVKRFAVNHPANRSASYPVYVPPFTQSIRFTLFNSDTLAKLEITAPDNTVITSSDAANPIEVSGAGTPIRVWQIANPQTGTYKVTVQEATRPGIITWLYAYQGLSAVFDNQLGSFTPGEPGDIRFSLVDSSGNPVTVSDPLKLKVAIAQPGEAELQFATPKQDGDKYSLAWTPKTSERATFNLALSDNTNPLLNCSLEFDFISRQPTATPTSTATSTPTATATSTATATPSATPTGPTPPQPKPAQVVAIFPQCVAPGDTVTLPMYLQYGGERAKLASLDWQGSLATSPGMNDVIQLSVNPLNPERGEFQVVLGPVSAAIKSLQLQLKAQENANGQPVPVFDVASTIPVLTTCNVVVIDSCTTGLWGTWFWPLMIVLLGLMILLLVLRFRSREDLADQQAGSAVYRKKEWHLLFWPLLVMFLLLLLVRWMGWCGTIPPWLFLVSILIWLIYALLIRFFPGRSPSQPRPWWLLLLLMALGFLGYLAINIPALSVLWLLLVLLMAWVILWYLGPDDLIKKGPFPPPPPPADFNIRVGPSGEPQEDGSVKLPVKLTYRGNDATAIPPKWHVRKWNVSVEAHDRNLTWSVDPEGREPEGSEPGNCIVTIQGVGLERTLLEVTADADVDVNDGSIKSASATGTILIVPINEGLVPDNATREVIREVPVPVIHEVIKEVEVTREVPIPIIQESIKEVAITRQVIVHVPDPAHPDDLTELEDIGTSIAQVLNQNGIFSFQQLACADQDQLNRILNEANLEMTYSKTWPQQARLADIAKRYGREEDRRNYEAYKAWLKDGIEPDEYDLQKKDRRLEALIWNRIAECTPVVLNLILSSSHQRLGKAIRIPLQINYKEDPAWMSMVEWKISAKVMPGDKEIRTSVQVIDQKRGEFVLVIDPVQDQEASQIQVTVWALINGRSIEIYYGQAITVQVSPPPGADPLEELEGIGPAVKKLLNENGVYTFEQLAQTDVATLNHWLNEKGFQRMDPKTWPQQAKLADIAHKYGREEDRQSYEAYKAWLVRGIEPDEVDKEEKDRRPVALTWPVSPEAMPDPLEELEGIGKDVAQVLNNNGIFTFRQLARADIKEINRWLNECCYERMDPKTWPQQAKLAGIAREFGTEQDRRSYEAYKAWLKGGIEPDEYKADEKDRRPVALTWYGTAELTEKAYPEIFE